ncbi:putative adenylyl-sulfate kinase [Nocardioides dokdonensis FR1436]|uniref:Adenylyl-sulfate kinase n=1 Tax=Nocardioides dokdonensis FR1436 TaxID=1300347 RepID=A0A1A9GL68_9ACTN|nr:adenylyl-sulfate kinase [Nocardioides dokdonensis]ANH38211.1 putative adenylyl-sulfate kinase [Nocardioides dokdonensis FR1436]
MSFPQHCPSPRELDDLELLVSGALAPLTAFNEPGSVVTLDLPAPVREQATSAGAVELVDPEGLPLARVSVPGGAVEPLTHAQYGPFRDRYLTPAQVQDQHPRRTVVPVVDALTEQQIAELSGLGPLVLLTLVGAGTPDLSATALIRATMLAAQRLTDAVVVAVPLASHGDVDADHALGVQVAHNYAGAGPVVAVPYAADDDAYADDIAAIVDRDRPAADEQGLVLFFTGLSGSGKSTLARALMDRILEQGTRTITSLDGDVVRRNLSAGLTFSKADRETNIRRIGWVAAEISRHGGLAVVSPIAPFDETRQQVRAMVDEAGGAFFLVHVATPLEECERRDRKGLYAKARAGEIPEFTGISSPYEEPQDADVVVDTTGRTIDDALGDVIGALAESGYLDLRPSSLLVEQTPPPWLVEQGGAPATTARRNPVTGATAAAQDAGPLKVLFVCTANICRSPYMELTARHLAAGDPTLEFASAGTHGLVDEPMNQPMVDVLADEVTGHEPFRSRRLTTAELEWADVVLTAEASHRQFILDDNPALFRKVFSLGQFVETVGDIGAGVHGRDLLAAMQHRRGPASTELDVADPYRRGDKAARTAADHVDRLLVVAIRALSTAPKAP